MNRSIQVTETFTIPSTQFMKETLLEELRFVQSHCQNQPHLIHYQTLDFAANSGTLYLSNWSGTTLDRILADFPNLPPRIIQNYMKQILQGLISLKAHGLTHERLSLDQLCLSSDGIIRIAGYFPSPTVAQVLQNAYSSFRIESSCPFADLYAFLTILAQCVVGQLEIRDIQLFLKTNAIQYQLKDLAAYEFTIDALDLMHESQEIETIYQTLFEHEFFISKKAHDPLHQLQKQLLSCLDKKKAVMRQIRQWNDAFEQEFSRKATKKERKDQIQQLVIRAKTLKSQASALRLELEQKHTSPRALSVDTTNSDRDSTPASSPVAVRSPAQQAFLATCENASPVVDTSSLSSASPSGRVVGRRVMHRRREIANIITSLQ